MSGRVGPCCWCRCATRLANSAWCRACWQRWWDEARGVGAGNKEVE